MTKLGAIPPNGSKRLLVTGAQGFVAGSVIQQAPACWEVHAVSRGPALLQRRGLSWHHCDPADPASPAELFRGIRPTAVIHTAALADIDYCETHPQEARSVNVGFTRVLAELCATQGAQFVFCSTDSIFDGEHAPYEESAPPGPVNVYAQTKIEAEQAVRSLGAQALIARLALVIGLPLLGAGNSFLPKLLASLRAGREVRAAANEVRTPIDVVTLGRALLELAGGSHSGIMHLAGNEAVNRFELGRRTATRFSLPPDLVVATDSSQLRGRARRSRDVSLNNAKARNTLTVPMLGLDDALNLIIQTANAPLV
jgi:dTDP-4-dehydrorhamnose reductase